MIYSHQHLEREKKKEGKKGKEEKEEKGEKKENASGLAGGCYDNAVKKPRELREINDEFAVNVGIIARQRENDRNIEDATNCQQGRSMAEKSRDLTSVSQRNHVIRWNKWLESSNEKYVFAGEAAGGCLDSSFV